MKFHLPEYGHDGLIALKAWCVFTGVILYLNIHAWVARRVPRREFHRHSRRHHGRA